MKTQAFFSNRSTACRLQQTFPDGHTVEESTTILSGVTMALVSLCKDVSKHVTDEGSVERLVLSWLSATDPASGCHFSDYINLPKK